MFGIIKSLSLFSVILGRIFVLLFAYMLCDEFSWAAQIKIKKIETEYFFPIKQKAENCIISAEDYISDLWERLKKAGGIIAGEE